VVVRDQIGAAVGLGSLQRLRRDLSARAGAVLDDHRLAQLDAQLLGQRAGDGIGAAAGREADQHLDRPWFGGRGWRQRADQRGAKQRTQQGSQARRGQGRNWHARASHDGSRARTG
jgi:hypothetical protein